MKCYIIVDNEGWHSQHTYPSIERAIQRGRMIYAPDEHLSEIWSVVEIDILAATVRTVYSKRVGE